MAIAQYEVRTPTSTASTASTTHYLAGKAQLTEQEVAGLDAVRGPEKGNCAACHPSRRGDRRLAAAVHRLHLRQRRRCRATRASRRTPIPAYFDLGLCGPERKELAARSDLCGAFKVPTLRNVARTAPYFHNGAFDDAREAVEFYARRDTNPGEWYPEGAAGVRKFDDLPPGHWPAP